MYQYLSDSDKVRIRNYHLYNKIFEGEHYEAFNYISNDFRKDYSFLRYITANFGGLLSRLSADMLFEEFPSFNYGKDGDADFMDAFFLQNRLKIQLYESGLEQSYNGDVVFRIRSKGGQVLIEDISPACYFPEINENNVREEPEVQSLYYKVKLAGYGDRRALWKEKHYKGTIVNELYEIDEQDNIVSELAFDAYMKNKDGDPLPKEIDTKIDDFLVFHIPNFRNNTRFYGLSDYKDILSLMFAVNNRYTKIDNILDLHGDPILAVPKGVLDDEGKVSKKAFGVIEVDSMEAGGGMPQYIVWDAKLESAFMEIDKMVELLMMMSETSPAMFGLDKGGQAESGRALKFKLLRTIAKKHRKELYYDAVLKEMLYTAQKFAKANDLQAGQAKITKEPVMPVIQWKDGVINDPLEQLEYEERMIDNGFETYEDAISTLHGLTQDEARDKYTAIQKEKDARRPQFTTSPVIKNQDDDQNNE